MAVTFTNTSNYLSRTTCPSVATLSLCGWFRTPASINSYHYPLVIVDDATHYGIYIGFLELGMVSGHMFVRDSTSGTDLFVDMTKVAATNTWYWIAMTRQAGTNNVKGFLALPSEATLTTGQGTPGTAATTPNWMGMGNDAWGDDCPATVAALKIWSGVVLSQAELEQERWYYTPQRTDGLWLWSPFNDQSDVSFRDYSGNGRDWTETGTVTQAGVDGPPISWGPARRTRIWVPVAAGGDQSISVTDSGAGADQLSAIAASLGISEAGSGSDVIGSILASASVADTGSGADSVSSLLAALLVADVGSGADALAAVAAALSIEDAGTGADSVSDVIAVLSVADSGAGADSSSATQEGDEKTVGDTGSGADAVGSVVVVLGVADSGSGEDSPGGPVAVVATADTGSGADAVASLLAALGVTDAGAGSDAPSVSAAMTVTDAGSALDEIAAITVTVTITETGTGADNLAVDQSGDLKSIVDSGSGSDVVVVDATASVSDSGSGADAPSATVVLAVSDSGSGVDTAIVDILIAVVDAGVGEDTVGTVTVEAVVADTATVADALTIAATLAAIADTGSGVDVAAAYDTTTQIAKIVFTLRTREAALELKRRLTSFTLRNPRS